MRKDVMLILVVVLFLIGCTKEEENIQPSPQLVPQEVPMPVSPTAQPTIATPVGFIGCSNTRQSVEGYDLVGGKNVWDVEGSRIHEYDGGSVGRWANKEKKFWDVFDEYLRENPSTKSVWWQLCFPKNEVVSYEKAMGVIGELRQRIPGVIVYVSPLAEYSPGVCSMTGVEGIERGQILAQEVDEKNADVLLGPVVGPMLPVDTDVDGCHITPQGRQKIGQQLKAFFG